MEMAARQLCCAANNLSPPGRPVRFFANIPQLVYHDNLTYFCAVVLTVYQ